MPVSSAAEQGLSLEVYLEGSKKGWGTSAFYRIQMRRNTYSMKLVSLATA